MNGISNIKIKQKKSSTSQIYKILALLIISNSLTFYAASFTNTIQAPIERHSTKGYLKIQLPLKTFLPKKKSGSSLVTLFKGEELILEKGKLLWNQENLSRNDDLFLEEEAVPFYHLEVPKDKLVNLLKEVSPHSVIKAYPYSQSFKQLKKTNKKKRRRSYVISI